MKRYINFLLLLFLMIFVILSGTLGIYADEPYIKLECEECDDYTQEENIYGNEANRFIKIEAINVGGTFPGAWIMFEDVNFYGNGASKLAVNYAKKPDSCAPDTALEFRLDSLDGELIADVPLTIAQGWGNYNLAIADLTRTVTGKHDVYVLMKGTHTPQYVYIGQLDYIEFFEAEEAPATGGEGDSTATPETSPTPSTSPSEKISPSPSQAANTQPEESATPANTGENPGSSGWLILVIVAGLIVIAAGIGVLITNKKKA